MGTLYVDDTQLVHWQGYLAGIPRVMYELGKRCVPNKGQRVVHVTWVKELGAFAEIDFEATLKRDNGIVYAKSDKVANADNVEVAAKPNSLQTASTKLKPITKRVIKKGLRTLGVENSRVVKQLQTVAVRVDASTYKTIEFQTGDALFITWGEWWDENFLTVLEDSASKGTHVIPIIHDVLPFTRSPQFSGHSTESLMQYCRRIVPVSSVVLCVSESTKNDLTKWLVTTGLTVPRIDVFRLGEDFEFATPHAPTDEAFTMSGLSGGDYTLTVGTVEARKNHTLLYYVHKLAKQRGVILPKAVIVGRRGWKTEQIYDFMTEDPEIKDMFVFMHNVSNEELSWLYDNAMFSVFPSMYEGWGMPIAESVARGVPCVCSNTTSMTEIAEEYVRHFSPFSTDECLAAIESLLNTKTLNDSRKKCQQYNQTTWESSHKQVMKSIKEIMHG